MTVRATSSIVEVSGNAPVQYESHATRRRLDFTFPVGSASDLRLIYTDAAGVRHEYANAYPSAHPTHSDQGTRDFIARPNAEGAGGYVIIGFDGSDAAADGTWLLYRDTPLSQPSDFGSQAVVSGQDLEDSLDRLTLQVQEAREVAESPEARQSEPAPWAESGNVALIPDDKLPSTIARDTEVAAVSTTLESDNRLVPPSSDVPDGHVLTASGDTVVFAAPAIDADSVDARIETFARAGDASVIPFDKLPTGSGGVVPEVAYEARVGGLESEVDTLNAQVSTRLTEGAVDARIEQWARSGDATVIPDAKLPDNLGGGLSEDDVDARIEQWARSGDATVIPDAKLPAATAVEDWAVQGNDDVIPLGKIPDEVSGANDLVRALADRSVTSPLTMYSYRALAIMRAAAQGMEDVMTARLFGFSNRVPIALHSVFMRSALAWDDATPVSTANAGDTILEPPHLATVSTAVAYGVVLKRGLLLPSQDEPSNVEPQQLEVRVRIPVWRRQVPSTQPPEWAGGDGPAIHVSLHGADRARLPAVDSIPTSYITPLDDVAEAGVDADPTVLEHAFRIDAPTLRLQEEHGLYHLPFWVHVELWKGTELNADSVSVLVRERAIEAFIDIPPDGDRSHHPSLVPDTNPAGADYRKVLAAPGASGRPAFQYANRRHTIIRARSRTAIETGVWLQPRTGAHVFVRLHRPFRLEDVSSVYLTFEHMDVLYETEVGILDAWQGGIAAITLDGTAYEAPHTAFAVGIAMHEDGGISHVRHFDVYSSRYPAVRPGTVLQWWMELHADLAAESTQRALVGEPIVDYPIAANIASEVRWAHFGVAHAAELAHLGRYWMPIGMHVRGIG